MFHTTAIEYIDMAGLTLKIRVVVMSMSIKSFVHESTTSNEET